MFSKSFIKAYDCYSKFEIGQIITINIGDNFHYVASILDHQPWYDINPKFPLKKLNTETHLIVRCIGISRIDGAAMFEYIMTQAEYRELKINEILE